MEAPVDLLRNVSGLQQVAVVRLRLIRISLVEPLTTASGTIVERSSVIVEVERRDGHVGWAECVALDGLDYPLAPVEEAWGWLSAGPDAWGSASRSAGRSPASATAPVSAVGALRDAVLDASLRQSGESLARSLGGEAIARAVESAAVLGVATDVDALVVSARAAVSRGHRHLVCKIRPGWDLEPLDAVRSELPGVALAADANGSYRPDDPALVAIGESGLAWLEQPVAAGDLEGSAQVTAMIEPPVILDESLLDAGALRRAIALDALNGINVKPGRVGGVHAAHQMIVMAADCGLDVLVGGLLETGVGRAASLAVAACPGVTLPTDLGPSDRYIDPDLTEPFVLRADGTIAVPASPGIGVEPDVDRLAVCTVRGEEILVRT